MASWQEVREFLRTRFALAKDSEELAALAWRVPIEPGPGAAGAVGPAGAESSELLQWIRISPISVHGDPWLTVLADVCAEERMSLPTAFSYLNQLPFGALLLWRGAFLFRHSLRLESLVLGDLDRMVRLVAHEAVRLRVALGLRALESDVGILNHYSG